MLLFFGGGRPRLKKPKKRRAIAINKPSVFVCCFALPCLFLPSCLPACLLVSAFLLACSLARSLACLVCQCGETQLAVGEAIAERHMPFSGPDCFPLFCLPRTLKANPAVLRIFWPATGSFNHVLPPSLLRGQDTDQRCSTTFGFCTQYIQSLKYELDHQVKDPPPLW